MSLLLLSKLQYKQAVETLFFPVCVHTDEKMHHEAYMNLVRLFEIPHIDNNKILRALIYSKDDKPPLVDGLSKEKVSTFSFLHKIQ